MVSSNKQNEAETDRAVSEYARGLLGASPANGGADSADDRNTSSPYHGY
jgi:hypothetical protein